MADRCEHHRDTGTPRDFRFPCAFPKCPRGIDGFELVVPTQMSPSVDWVVVGGKWEQRMRVLETKIFERWLNGGTFFWKERRG